MREESEMANWQSVFQVHVSQGTPRHAEAMSNDDTRGAKSA